MISPMFGSIVGPVLITTSFDSDSKIQSTHDAIPLHLPHLKKKKTEKCYLTRVFMNLYNSLVYIKKSTAINIFR